MLVKLCNVPKKLTQHPAFNFNQLTWPFISFGSDKFSLLQFASPSYMSDESRAPFNNPSVQDCTVMMQGALMAQEKKHLSNNAVSYSTWALWECLPHLANAKQLYTVLQKWRFHELMYLAPRRRRKRTVGLAETAVFPCYLSSSFLLQTNDSWLTTDLLSVISNDFLVWLE